MFKMESYKSLENDHEVFIEVKNSLQNIIDSIALNEEIGTVLDSFKEIESQIGNISPSKPHVKRKRPLENFLDILHKELTDSEVSEDEDFAKKIKTKVFDDDLYDKELTDSEDEDELSKKKAGRIQRFYGEEGTSDNHTGSSDEETQQTKENTPAIKKSKAKPKPKRRTLKDNIALKENLTSIYSESQRMLREKRISLPYHKPKISNLQDFLKRKSLNNSAVPEDELCSALKKTMKHELKKPALVENDKNKLETEPAFVTEDDDFLEDLPSFEDLCRPKNSDTNVSKKKISLIKEKLSQLKESVPKIQGTPNSFIDLDSRVDQNGVKDFLDRFAKHTNFFKTVKHDAEQEIKLHIVTKNSAHPNEASLKGTEIKVKVRPLGSDGILVSQDKVVKISSLKETLWSQISKKKQITREEKQEAHDMDNEEGFEDEEEDEFETDGEDNSECEEPTKSPLKDLKTLEVEMESKNSDLLNELNTTVEKEYTLDSSSELESSLITSHQPEGGHKYGMNKKEIEEQWLKSPGYPKNRPSWLSQSLAMPKTMTQISYEDSPSLRLDASTMSEEFEVEEEKKSKKDSLFTQTQNCNGEEDELLDLCSGNFGESPNDDNLVTSENLSTSNPKGLPLFNHDQANTQELLGLCSGSQKGSPNSSGNFAATNPNTYSGKEKPKVNSFYSQNKAGTQEFNELLGLCSGKFGDTPVDSEDDDIVDSTKKVAGNKGKQAVFDSDSEDEPVESNNESDESDGDDSDKSVYVSKKERRSAMFLDNEAESDGEEEDEENDVEEENPDSDEQDSDEEEEETQSVIPVAAAKIKLNEFFDEEAELSGSDIGSEDEADDEEAECPDLLNDQLSDDEETLRKQVEKDHLKWLIEDDKREVRFFKNAFLEDGDLHTDGDGRTRKFRWRNLSQLDDEEGGEKLSGDEAEGKTAEEQDETWRKDRYEREKWMAEQQALSESPVKKIKKKFRISNGLNRSLSKNEEFEDKNAIIDKNNSLISQSFLLRNTEYLHSLSDKFIKQNSTSVGRRSTKNFVFLSTSTDPIKRPADEEIKKTVTKKPKFNIRQNATLAKPIIKKSVFDLL